MTSTLHWLAAGLTGLAVCLVVPDPGSRTLARRLAVATGPARSRWLVRGFPGWPLSWTPGRVVAACGVAIGLLGWLGPGGLLAIPIAGVCWYAFQRVRLLRSTRAADIARGASVCEVCEVVAAELRAGRTPVEALSAASPVLPELGSAVAAGRLGADVPAAISEIGSAGTTNALRSLAAAWSVADRSGAGLADVLDRLAAKLRSDEELRAEVAAQLAAPRATARVVASLPIVGLALGYGLGADPLAFLLGTSIGIGCLLGGSGLVLAGLLWVERLASAAELRS